MSRPKITEAEAVDLGYWYARDGQSWMVGCGHGADTLVLEQGLQNKPSARRAMLAHARRAQLVHRGLERAARGRVYAMIQDGVLRN
jgi:hypothetical protein